jgi:hypothetical protein
MTIPKFDVDAELALLRRKRRAREGGGEQPHTA